MDKNTASTVTFIEDSDDLSLEKKRGYVNMILDIEGQEKEATKESTLAENICTYTMCFIMSFIIGYSFTSYTLIATHGLEKYSTDFYPDNHQLFKNLCPAFLYAGSVIGTFVMLIIKKYTHLGLCRITAVVFLIGYLLQAIYPHIIVIFIARFLMGIASGVASLVTPQILYFKCKQGIKGLVTSFYPFFLLSGLTCAVALIPAATAEYYRYLHAIPLSLLSLSLLFSLKVSNLIQVKKDKGLIEVVKFLFQNNALKTTVSVILIHCFQKTTGVDFIGNFSSSLFEGKNAYAFGLAPLITATLATFATSFLPDRYGRKALVVSNLGVLSLITFCMGWFDTNLACMILFILFYNAGLGSIPNYYQNEIVPAEYVAAINEMGTFVNVLLGLCVALYAAFLIAPSKATLWFTFCGFSAIGAIFMGITMPETKGILLEERNFIANWINLSFTRKN